MHSPSTNTPSTMPSTPNSISSQSPASTNPSTPKPSSPTPSSSSQTPSTISQERLGEISEIEFSELSEQLEQLVILDVRTREEARWHGKIPQSNCLPLSEIDSALAMDPADFMVKYLCPKPERDTRIVTYCMDGTKARSAAEVLALKGFNVSVYTGSFKDWKKNGGTVDLVKPFPQELEDDEEEENSS